MAYALTQTRSLGRSGIALPVMGFGCAPLGGMLAPTSQDDALATLQCAWDLGLRHFDVAPQYGHGLAEHRLGLGLRDKPRDAWLLSTKIGRLLRPRRTDSSPPAMWVGALPFDLVFDYSYDATLRSLEDSLQRLGLEHIDMVMIHDVSLKWHGLSVGTRFHEAMGGAHRALVHLRDQGVIRAFGAGLNDTVTATRFVEEGDLDYVMIAGRYTLLDQSAQDTLLPACTRRGVGVMMAGPFNSGILAAGCATAATYHYNPPPPEVVQAVRRLEAIAQRYAVPLQAAALQFPLAHPAVTSVVAGFRQPGEVQQAAAWLAQPIPEDFWCEVRAAIVSSA